MKCADFKKTLSMLARGELEPAERERHELHAAQCPSCARQFAEIRALKEAVAAAAAGDAANADVRLEGFEERLSARQRQRAMAEVTRGNPARPGPRRLALGLSLAFNLAAAVLLLIFFLNPEAPLPWPQTAVHGLPAGLPSQAQMRKIFGELEILFGDRLSWVSQSGGRLAMSIIHNQADAEAAHANNGPLMALIYWTAAEGKPTVSGHPAPVIILTRMGRPIRERIPIVGGGSSLEIAVNSLTERRDGFDVQTELSTGDSGQGDGSSSLATALSLAPGRPAKLGELRVGDRYYNAWLAVQALGEMSGHEDKS